MSNTTARERYAAITALLTALTRMQARAKADVIKAENDEAADTLLGPVNITRTDPAPKVDDELLVAWVMEDHADAIVMQPTVDPDYRARIVGDLDVIGGRVVFRSTGEPAPFAEVSPQGKPVVSYPNSDARKHAVEWACVMIDDEHGANLIAELFDLAAREVTK